MRPQRSSYRLAAVALRVISSTSPEWGLFSNTHDSTTFHKLILSIGNDNRVFIVDLYYAGGAYHLAYVERADIWRKDLTDFPVDHHRKLIVGLEDASLAFPGNRLVKE